MRNAVRKTTGVRRAACSVLGHCLCHRRGDLRRLSATGWQRLTPVSAEVYLVRGRAYEMAPQPHYSYCTDPGDATQLTDGRTNSPTRKNLDGEVHRWLGCGPYVPAVVWFDLGQPATLSRSVFNTTGGGAAGVVYVGVQVLVSLDDKHYTLAGQQPSAGAARGQAIHRWKADHRLPPTHARAVCGGRRPAAQALLLRFYRRNRTLRHRSARKSTNLRTGSTFQASGCKALQALLARQQRVRRLVASLTSPIASQATQWPEPEKMQELSDVRRFEEEAASGKLPYERPRAEFTGRHRARAAKVYERQILWWETVPDDEFTPLSLPPTVRTNESAGIDLATNAAEAAAVGVANLTDKSLPLRAGWVPSTSPDNPCSPSAYAVLRDDQRTVRCRRPGPE